MQKKNNHTELIEQLLTKYTPIIKRVSYQFGRSIQGYSVEDLIQEGNLKLIEIINMRVATTERYETPYDIGGNYVKDSLTNHFIDLQRKTSRRRTAEAKYKKENESKRADSMPDCIEILDCLSPVEREVAVLKSQKYTNIEIANYLDINRRTVSTLLENAAYKLTTFMELSGNPAMSGSI